MIIKTSQPVFKNRNQITKQIANYWDRLSDGWKNTWGDHIHHGYYENDHDITPHEAQEKLLDKLFSMISIKPHHKILDVGCGMGGTSIYLAKKYHVDVTGITLSQRQVEIALQQCQIQQITNIRFKIEDALNLTTFNDNTFDFVIALESCEQFFDKNLFVRQAYRVLKPGGQLMVVTWCSDQEEYSGKLAKKYHQLCLAFDLPYMPSMDTYHKIFSSENFSIQFSLDWSNPVKKSWNIGLSLLEKYSLYHIIKNYGWRGFRFAKQVKLMRDAFAENRVKYGVFLLNKLMA